jgi:endonuclease-8
VPEGHSVHRLARELHRAFAGEALRASSPQGRFASGAALLDGRVLERVDAWGKHLFLRFEDDLDLHVHLGLYGHVVCAAAPAPEVRGAVRLRLEGQRSYADLRGPTACDLVSAEERAAILARLGPDPLRRDADPALVRRRITSSRAAIAGLLMDQSVLSGVGNIYRAELLHRHGVSPFTEGRAMPGDLVDEMWADLVLLMRDGVRRGRILTVEPRDVAALAALDVDRPSSDDPRLDGGEDTPSRRRQRRSTGAYVYGREGRPCVRCGTLIRAEDFQGRRLYWCPGCQTR